MLTLVWMVAAALASAIFAFLVGRWAERRRLDRARSSAECVAAQIRLEGEKEAEELRRTAELKGREAAYQAREEWEREEKRRRSEVERAEARLDERRTAVDRRHDLLTDREKQLKARETELETRDRELAQLTTEQEALLAETARYLESRAGMSSEEALRELKQSLEEQARSEAANTIREITETAKRKAEAEARNIISLAIQRIAADHTAESVVSVVSLPSDEMKGRIIGREGRNIRAFEHATGVDVIIDDTPEAVILSAFDPIRRETARVSLEKLVIDGRIHPGRIEEVVSKSRAEVEATMINAAEEVLYELGVQGVHPEVVKAIGKLKFRTSYGQNQLLHSKEVAILAGNMAAEMGLDAQLTRRMGLLHDVGKGMTHQHEGTHVDLGWELCKKFGEPDQVLNAIRAHHDEEPHHYPETFLVTAADTISGSRPGARREMFETYVKRLEKLEEITQGMEGVERCFAIQAGREIRVMVDPEQVDDSGIAAMTDRIARRLEEELQYPGQIKVVVIRETRAVDFAR